MGSADKENESVAASQPNAAPVRAKRGRPEAFAVSTNVAATDNTSMVVDTPGAGPSTTAVLKPRTRAPPKRFDDNGDGDLDDRDLGYEEGEGPMPEPARKKRKIATKAKGTSVAAKPPTVRKSRARNNAN